MKTDIHYYPVCLDLKHRSCLVVGGGDVGTRKIMGLLAAGARVTVVCPELNPELRELVPDRIEWCRREYNCRDLEGMFLVFGATNDEAVNRRIHTDASDKHILCNISDRPEVCNFILPSVVRRGDLVVAVSTSGKSPAFAKKLRKDLEQQFGEEYITFLQLMGVIRERLLSQRYEPEAHKRLFEALIESGLLDLLHRGDDTGADELLRRVLGPEFELESLLKAV
jgi:precorrin-2 dehydrogenase/sirohydrochlorin ferrochelatase